MECPNCGRHNLSSALRCDCGYNFQGNQEDPGKSLKEQAEELRRKITQRYNEDRFSNMSRDAPSAKSESQAARKDEGIETSPADLGEPPAQTSPLSETPGRPTLDKPEAQIRPTAEPVIRPWPSVLLTRVRLGLHLRLRRHLRQGHRRGYTGSNWRWAYALAVASKGA